MVNSGTLLPGNGVPLDDNTSGRTEVLQQNVRPYCAQSAAHIFDWVIANNIQARI